MKKRLILFFILSLAVALFIGWYGGTDWAVRSSENAFWLLICIYVSVIATSLLSLIPESKS